MTATGLKSGFGKKVQQTRQQIYAISAKHRFILNYENVANPSDSAVRPKSNNQMSENVNHRKQSQFTLYNINSKTTR